MLHLTLLLVAGALTKVRTLGFRMETMQMLKMQDLELVAMNRVTRAKETYDLLVEVDQPIEEWKKQ